MDFACQFLTLNIHILDDEQSFLGDVFIQNIYHSCTTLKEPKSGLTANQVTLHVSGPKKESKFI